MTDPTNPTIDKLTKILVELHRAGSKRTEQYIRIAQGDPARTTHPFKRIEKDIEVAKEQVIAWALEAVGSDELITDEDLRAYPEDSTERWEKEARNQLRREIKAKLTGGKP